jgi:hypothetical protein
MPTWIFTSTLALQPNIFPKFLFHFADFPYELYIHQPETAHLGNLLRFIVRASPMVLSLSRLIFFACIFKGFRSVPAIKARDLSQPGSCKKLQLLFRLAIASSRLNAIPKTAHRYRKKTSSSSFCAIVYKRLHYTLSLPFKNQVVWRFWNFNQIDFRGPNTFNKKRVFSQSSSDHPSTPDSLRAIQSSSETISLFGPQGFAFTLYLCICY